MSEMRKSHAASKEVEAEVANSPKREEMNREIIKISYDNIFFLSESNN